MSVLSVIDQTSGKGQRGHKWSSAPGENLTFSIVLKGGSSEDGKGMMASDQYMINRSTAQSVVLLLEKHGIKSWIKQPNDIYVNDRKICGTLIENSLQGNTLVYSIIGIGLNVNQTIFDPTLPNPISMSSITGTHYDIRSLLDEFMDIFLENLSFIRA